MTEGDGEKKGLDLSELRKLLKANPETQQRAAMLETVAAAVKESKARQERMSEAITNLRAAERAQLQAEKDEEARRHRELVDAMEKAGERSWRRDIALLVIGGIIGAIGAYIVALLTQ